MSEKAHKMTSRKIWLVLSETITCEGDTSPGIHFSLVAQRDLSPPLEYEGALRETLFAVIEKGKDDERNPGFYLDLRSAATAASRNGKLIRDMQGLLAACRANAIPIAILIPELVIGEEESTSEDEGKPEPPIFDLSELVLLTLSYFASAYSLPLETLTGPSDTRPIRGVVALAEENRAH